MIFSSLESTFTSMVQYARMYVRIVLFVYNFYVQCLLCVLLCLRYFPESATREILDELLPRFVPTHNSTQEVISTLVLLLPINVMPSALDNTVRLWLDDLMQLWKVCHNSPQWEPVSLLINGYIFFFFKLKLIYFFYLRT